MIFDSSILGTLTDLRITNTDLPSGTAKEIPSIKHLKYLSLKNSSTGDIELSHVVHPCKSLETLKIRGATLASHNFDCIRGLKSIKRVMLLDCGADIEDLLWLYYQQDFMDKVVYFGGSISYTSISKGQAKRIGEIEGFENIPEKKKVAFSVRKEE